MSKQETGPVYGVPLIDALPIGTGVMMQQMPRRDDLEQVRKRNERVAAGYEVLLAHFRECQEIAQKLHDQFRKLESTEGNDPIRCSRMHFGDWADALEEIISRGNT